MNLSSAAIVLRERSALELTDLSVRFVRSLAPLAYLRVCFAVLLPLWSSCLLLRYAFDVAWGWVWLVAWIETTFAQGAFTLLAGRLLFADDVRAGSILIGFTRRGLAYTTLLLLRGLLAALSSITLVGPLLVWIHGAYLHEIVYLENASFRSALGRSRRFVRGRTGSVLEMLLVLCSMMLVAVVLAETLGLVLVEFVFQIALPVENLTEDGGSIAALFGLFAVVPWTSTLRFLFYINERTVRDGWDVQVRFLGIRDGLEKHLG